MRTLQAFAKSEAPSDDRELTVVWFEKLLVVSSQQLAADRQLSVLKPILPLYTTIVTHNTPLYKHIPINHISTSTTTLVNILILTY